jgi:hypothetical protein
MCQGCRILHGTASAGKDAGSQLKWGSLRFAKPIMPAPGHLIDFSALLSGPEPAVDPAAPSQAISTFQALREIPALEMRLRRFGVAPQENWDWDPITLPQLFELQYECLSLGWCDPYPEKNRFTTDGQHLYWSNLEQLQRFDPLQLAYGPIPDQADAHPVERLETACLFEYLLQTELQYGCDAALTRFAYIKQLALNMTQRWRRQLEGRRARRTIIEQHNRLEQRWQQALAVDLAGLYYCEGWRSHWLAAMHELQHQVSPITLQRFDWLQDTVARHYRELRINEAFLPEHKQQRAGGLLEKITQLRRQAQRQLKDKPA